MAEQKDPSKKEPPEGREKPGARRWWEGLFPIVPVVLTLSGIWLYAVGLYATKAYYRFYGLEIPSSTSVERVIGWGAEAMVYPGPHLLFMVIPIAGAAFVDFVVFHKRKAPLTKSDTTFRRLIYGVFGYLGILTCAAAWGRSYGFHLAEGRLNSTHRTTFLMLKETQPCPQYLKDELARFYR